MSDLKVHCWHRYRNSCSDPSEGEEQQQPNREDETLTTEAAAAPSSVCLSVCACTQPAARPEGGIARDCLAPGRGGGYGSRAAVRFPVRWWKTGLYLWAMTMTPVWLIMGYYQWNLSGLKIRDSCPGSPTSPLAPKLYQLQPCPSALLKRRNPSTLTTLPPTPTPWHRQNRHLNESALCL